MKTKPDHKFDSFEQIYKCINVTPILSAGRLVKIYDAFFETENDYNKVINALQYFESEKSIPLESIKKLAGKLDQIICKLGNITLVIEPTINKTNIVLELKEKLRLNQPDHIDFLEKKIQELISQISNSCKDRNLCSCVDLFKAKAWKLLETLDQYAKTEYHKSIF